MEKSNRMKILRAGFLVLVAIFLVRYFYRNYDDIKALHISLSPLPFAVSLLFYCMYKMTQASLWHYITVINDASIPYLEAIKAYLYSILGKYIPGKVFMLLARIPAYKERDVSADKVTVCFLFENCCTILGASLLFVISILFFPNEVLGNYKWGALILIAVFLFCLQPKILNAALGLLEKISKKKLMRIPMTYQQILKVVGLFVLNWLVYGFGAYMLVCSIYPLPLSKCLYVGGVYALSCIAGILAVFSPSGIGVREGIFALGLGLLMDTNYAVVIALVARMWAVLTELVLIGLIFIVDKIIRSAKGGHKQGA